MMLNQAVQRSSNSTCYLKSECRTEADRKAVDKLFSHNWDYFVIKRDEGSNEMAAFVECCGSEFKVGQ